jgi:DNA polymerase V
MKTDSFIPAIFEVDQKTRVICPLFASAELMAAALHGLKSLYRLGYRYRKVGVMLAEIVRQYRYKRRDLFFFSQPATSVDKRLMAALDRINGRWGRQTIQYGMTTAEDKPWMMRQTRKSPACTINWYELPLVKTASMP